jgi:hypothetical protein
MHEDTQTNQSTVSSASGFTTASASSTVTATLQDQVENVSQAATASLDLAGVATSTPLYVGIVYLSSTRYPTAVDIGGNSGTAIVEQAGAGAESPDVSWWVVNKPASDTPTLTLTANVSMTDWMAFVYTVDVASTVVALESFVADQGGAASASLDMSTDVVTDQCILLLGGESRGTGEVVLNGVTSGTRIIHAGNTAVSGNSGTHTATTDESPRTMSITLDGAQNTDTMSGAVIVLEAT